MPLIQASSTIADSMLAEFEIQASVTRRFLERLPEDKLTWKPHQKSLTAGQLALHLATTPGNVVQLAKNSPVQARSTFDFPQPASRDEVLKAFEENIATVRRQLPELDDAAMNEAWRLMKEEREIFSVPRHLFLRDVMLSHWYQHRGQFSVYLRLLDIPVPASWGPSADEPPRFLQKD
jgi:uncharacterized damage-inducible protein DinB